MQLSKFYRLLVAELCVLLINTFKKLHLIKSEENIFFPGAFFRKAGPKSDKSAKSDKITLHPKWVPRFIDKVAYWQKIQNILPNSSC